MIFLGQKGRRFFYNATFICLCFSLRCSVDYYKPTYNSHNGSYSPCSCACAVCRFHWALHQWVSICLHTVPLDVRVRRLCGKWLDVSEKLTRDSRLSSYAKTLPCLRLLLQGPDPRLPYFCQNLNKAALTPSNIQLKRTEKHITQSAVGKTHGLGLPALFCIY